MEGLCRIEVDNKLYFILTKPENDYLEGFEIQLCDGHKTWKKSVSKEEVSTMASAVDMSEEEYAKQTKNALIGATSWDTKYVYQVKIQSKSLHFAWKKSLEDGLKRQIVSITQQELSQSEKDKTIAQERIKNLHKFQLGSLTLDEMENCSVVIMDMFGVAVRQINQFKVDVAHLESENSRLSNERRHTLELLDKCVSEKDNMENDLYFKFASVLNKKKEKIRQLKSQVEDMGADATDARPGKSQAKARSPMSESLSRTPSPSHSDTEVTKDEKPEEKPSTSADLFPSVEEDEIITNPKRRRRRGPQKETPKSKLVLPKVPSVKKTLSSSSEESFSSSRLRKRMSTRSEPDPDDLMAEMAEM